MDNLVHHVAAQIIRRRWLTLAGVLLLVCGAASFARFLTFESNYRIFFSQSNPQLVAFEQLQASYARSDNILFVLKARSGDIFEPSALAAIVDMTRQAWQIPFSQRVDSVTNFQHSYAEEDTIVVRDLVPDRIERTDSELEAIRAAALAEPLLVGSLVSPDGDAAGVNVTLRFPEESMTEVPEAVAEARAIAERIRREYADIDIALTGIAMQNNAFGEAAQADISTLIPGMYVVITILLMVCLRSLSGAFTSMVVVTLATATSLGLAGMLGIPLSSVAISAPTIVLTLAVADCMHILVTLRQRMGEGASKTDALKASLQINFAPVSITSLTTMVGFLALNFSDSPPFWHLGNITAIGVASAWFLSLTCLPALASILPMKAPRRVEKATHRASWHLRYVEWMTRRYKWILYGMGACSLVLMAWLPRLELNDEWVKYFSPALEYRTDTEFALENLTGVYPVQFSLDSGRESGVSDPAFLQQVDSFSSWLRTQPEVRHVFTYTDILKRINKNLHGDDPAYDRLPTDQALAAQYLLLYELSLPYGLDLNDRITVDKSATRVTATLPEVSTAGMVAFTERCKDWLARNTPEIATEPTGVSVLFALIGRRNVDSMLAGNLWALGLIAVTIAIALRSLRMGLLSLVPNAFPILITFGLWSLVVQRVGMAAATVSATSLGIIVDDTVHFLSKYQRGRRKERLNRPDAVAYAMRTVAAPICMTTVVLACGFAVLANSHFLVNAQMGRLTALAITLALIFDLAFLPALLLVGTNPKSARAPAAGLLQDVPIHLRRKEVAHERMV